MKSLLKIFGLMIALALVVACGGEDPTPTPPATTVPTSVPTVEPTVVPTAAPTVEPTAEPAAQPESPLATESPLAGPASPLAEPGATYADPFAYCAAAGTVDQPDDSYVGPAAPEAIAIGLRLAFETPDTPLEFYQDGMVWRCADGMVVACAVGANLPCSEKADLSTEPSEEIVAYCEENPDSDFVPMVVTGRATVYQWSCADGEPQIGETISSVDAQGYLADIWYVIDAEAVNAALEAEGANETEADAETSDAGSDDTPQEDTESEAESEAESESD